MIYSVRHVSTVKYASPVSQAQFNLRLSPWSWKGQTLRKSSLVVEPAPDTREEIAGPYGVNTTSISYAEPLEKLEVTSEFEIEVNPPAPPASDPAASAVRDAACGLRDMSVLSPAPYLFASRIAGTVDAIDDWACRFFQEDAGTIESARALMSAIHEEFTYSTDATTSTTPTSEAFEVRAGVCQDFAHIMIIALRAFGIPAAYVSGYLRTLPPPGQPRLVGADAMHAWVNVWCGEELGWIGFDPTNDCLTRDDHIVIGMGRDYADVAPIDGTFIGSAPQTMTSAVDVTTPD